MERQHTENDLMEFGMERRLRELDPDLHGAIELLRDKVQGTLELCSSAVRERTPFVITQKRVEVEWLG